MNFGDFRGKSGNSLGLRDFQLHIVCVIIGGLVCGNEADNIPSWSCLALMSVFLMSPHS